MQAWPTIVSVLADDGNRPMMGGLRYIAVNILPCSDKIAKIENAKSSNPKIAKLT